jgi:hypothetical protein
MAESIKESFVNLYKKIDNGIKVGELIGNFV